MKQIYQRVATIRDTVASPDILIMSRTFLPTEGGSEEYIYNRCLQEREKVIVLTANCIGDRAFDRAQDFPIYRWQIPTFWYDGLKGIFLTPLFNFVCNFLLAIKLYFRYHYRYIEWIQGCDFLCLLVLSYLLPIRFFIYLNENEILRALRNPIARSLFAFTLKRAAGIICHSCFTRDFVTKHFQFNTPTHVIHPVVRREKFDIKNSTSIEHLRLQVRNSYNIPQSSVVILSVGTLHKHQGNNLVIDNLPLLLTLGLDVHYIICGQGPFEQKLRSQVQHLRLDRWVHFAGHISNSKLAGYYAACDIFAMLTLFDRKAASIESFSIAHLEAGYFSKPVIASCFGTAMDVIRHGENGILVNPNSGNEMLAAFRQLCENKQLREKLGRRGKVLANKRSLHRWLYVREARYSCLLT
ncbi:glycosyltransferase family 4 protein [Chlorogloeopsis sp. ULAP01]|uniref:glycosyltransferase family 4 protein n=1 Tax=Chlorogloeopsis sp. ULAP01 TaxID=3056483 RepID=UPI0025AA6FAD|nr:glycosyltransferase family 4 protein [Chlorogloeopsis sp. ULAP01]MDM9381357.1 glycosyltransferase family 4 protein [Chlorogloeopsis sp. ULAP01]